jgi:chromosome segregation protein
MKLKQIQLQGFKSFVDRTVLGFTDNITCIVGPNGCGKSNIVDAIRWAMGEMSAKQLRGGSMEDVIFHGSENLPPTGMAEVTLVFDNSDGLAPPEYKSFSEIQITRRLFRSGDSEYYINKTPCRLRDITDLFLGSGAGTKAYSMVEQGRIDNIVTMKPEQRRSLVEEAAGVSKYRIRKQEASRKMEATRQNLLRIRDIIIELKRQMNSLNRQAKKAERFNKYRQTLKEIELELVTFKALGLKEEQNKVKESLTELENKEIEISTTLEKAQSGLEQKKTGIIDIERGLSEVQSRMLEAGREAERAEQALVMLVQKRESLDRDSSRLSNEKEELSARNGSISGEIKSLEKEEKNLSESIVQAEDVLKRAEFSRDEKNREYNELREAADTLDKHLVSIKSESEKLLERVSWAGKRKEELERRKGVIKERQAKLEVSIEEQARTNLSYNEKLYQLNKELSSIKDSFAQCENDLSTNKKTRDEVSETLKNLESEHTSLASRLESLLEMRKNFEGYQSGVKAIMKRKDKLAAEGMNGTYNLITEVIKTEPEYELALEAVLGERLQTVLVKSREHGLDNINFLREESGGRSSFAPLEGASCPEISVPSVLLEVGARPLAAQVQVVEKFEPAVKSILGDALLVDDIISAAEAREKSGSNHTLVTKDGVLLDPAGIIAGGSPDSFAGFLQKKREMEELEEKVTILRGQIDQTREKLEGVNSKIKELTQNWETLRDRSYRMEIEKNNLEKDLRQGTNTFNSLKGEIENLKIEIEEVVESGKDLDIESEEAKATIDRDKIALDRVMADLEDRRGSLHRLKAERDGEAERCTSAQIRAAGLSEKKQSIKNQLSRLANAVEEINTGLKRRDQELNDLSAKFEELKTGMEQGKTRRDQVVVTARDLETKVEEERARYEKESEILRSSEGEIKEIFNDREKVKNHRMETELLMSQLKLKWEGLEENVSDKFSRGLDDVLLELGELIGDQFPINDKNAKREELKRKLERMGNVNLTAIEEFDELNDRYTFLTNQEADLIQALDNLEETIAKINSTYKRAFKKTFEHVNTMFQEVFPRLFLGGKAFLQLTNPDDLLESGVEIMVQPPGKKLKTIALLSGGEKSLTAAALIISLFLTKPSPFCLLDEADAALDDVNVVRFNEIIKELSNTSQLVVITHNKATMELADTLYGVTMERKGVSKIVSVKLRKSEEIDAAQ